MILRTAVCACGQLKAICEGDPDRISICACTDCQRRTGSMYGVGAYYKQAQVKPNGNSRTFNRSSDAGRSVTLNFCPDCGSTVYWRLELRPHHIGVAVGAFSDPSFPNPQIAVWLKNKPDWITFPEALPSYQRAQE